MKFFLLICRNVSLKMVREMITVQVGQCGNQIAYKFWQLALQQHSKLAKTAIYDDALSSFFKNMNGSSRLPVGSKLFDLKARSLVVDMEQGVLNSMMKGNIRQIFDKKQFISSVSGAGNNWAHGHFQYGQQYSTKLQQKIKEIAQECDSLQAFFMLHSLGGGTGSGVGTYILGYIFPQVFRFTGSVFPSNKTDDVITSPYNSILSLNQLIAHADCVLPIDNQALLNIIQQVDKTREETKSSLTDNQQGRDKPYDRMNNLVAHLLSNLTCSMRFQGILNVDFNQITMNLVPYPQLKFLLPALAPLYSILDSKLVPRRFDQMFDDVLDPRHQFIECTPLAHKFLSVGFILRGKVSFSDVNFNIRRLRQSKRMNMIYWNTEGFKYGICNNPPLGQQYSVLSLSNNTCVYTKFEKMIEKFNKLFKTKKYVHHYQKYMELQQFVQAQQNTQALIERYKELQVKQAPPKVKRLKPLRL